MSRFLVQRGSVKGNKIHITGDEAHHILDVMRLKVSDEVVVFDGTGMEYCGVVRAADRKSLDVEIKNRREVTPQSRVSVTLIQAIPKKEKMDYIAQKATELGVSCMIPVTTARTIPEWDDAKRADVLKRWRRISQEAAKQCGRLDIPQISPITDFTGVVTGAVLNTAPAYALKLIATLSDEAISLKDVLKSIPGGKIALAIGPEGDFTPEETGFALKAGFKVISLGPLILKSDTAGLAALSMINYEYAD